MSTYSTFCTSQGVLDRELYKQTGRRQTEARCYIGDALVLLESWGKRISVGWTFGKLSGRERGSSIPVYLVVGNRE